MSAAKKEKTELQEAVYSLKPFFKRAAWLSVIASLLILAPNWYMLEVYDRVVNSRSHMTLVMLTILVLGCYVVMEMLEWARGEVLYAGSQYFDRKLGGRVFDAIFESSLRRGQGASAQPMADFRTVRDFLHSPAVTAAMDAPVSLVFLVLIFAIGPLLGWVALAGAVLQAGITWLNERSTRPPLSQANRSAVMAQQYADGTLRNAQVIESMGMLKSIHARWMGKQREFLGLQAEASDRASGYQAASKLLQNVMSSALLGLSCWLLLRNSLNGGGGMMIIASVLGGRVLAPLIQVVAVWTSVVNVREAWYRLDGLLQQFPARPASMPLPPPKGRLQVEGLMAGAPGNPMPILRGVQFALNSGDVLAVVGPSASGKTTLARLLIGLWPAVQGKVRLDGADIFSWNKAELGPYLGYLPQGVELQEGTLAENIARFGPVDQDKVEAAARAVGLHEHIMELPGSYDHPVGRDGAIFSGGQRQRIALARAIYGDPVFVVLDEPNSSLDEAGDAALAQTLTTLKSRGTTFVVMTHRASVLSVADKMLVLKDGQMQAFGPRDEVLAAITKAAAQAQQQAAQQGRQGAPSTPLLTAAV